MRRIAGWTLVLALAAATVAEADDALAIKVKRSGKGDVTEQDKQQVETVFFKFQAPDGKVLREERGEKTIHQVYKETILEKDAGKKAVRLRRTYTTAMVKSVEGEKHLPYEGKSVIVEKKGVKYRFTVEGGEELHPEDSELLHMAFNRGGDESDDDALEKAFFPPRPVRPGESWALDCATVLKALEKDSKQSFPVDRTKVTATGKMVRAYSKEGRQYAALDIHLTLPLKGDLPMGKGQKGAPIQPGSRMVYHAVVDGCIDGTACDAAVEIDLEVDLIATVRSPDGKDLKMTRRVVQKGKSVARDLSHK